MNEQQIRITEFANLFSLIREDLQKELESEKDFYKAISNLTNIPRNEVKKLSFGLMYGVKYPLV